MSQLSNHKSSFKNNPADRSIRDLDSMKFFMYSIYILKTSSTNNKSQISLKSYGSVTLKNSFNINWIFGDLFGGL